MFITAHGCHLDPLDCQGRKLEDLYIDRSRSPLLKRRACDRWTKGRNEKQERWAHRGPLTAFSLSDVYIWTDPSFTRIWLISSPNQPYSSIIPREAHHPQNSGDRHNKTDRSFLKKEKEDRQTSSASSTASISPPFHVSCCWTERLHHYSQLIVPK